VQDRYAGDVGDFLKLGLLRHLARSPDAGGAGLTIGLNWYLAPDEGHNADGKHTAYLQPSNRQHASLAACDGELMRCLAAVMCSRSVRTLDACGALPDSSPTHSEKLDPHAGLVGRQAWHHRALHALATADVVLADPDNGICGTTSAPKLQKYALLSELADYAHRGQSIVGYHHADRSASAETQARRRLDELAAGVAQDPVGTVIAHRGSCRFFLVTAAQPHAARLAAALGAFSDGWKPHVELARPG
jgi:hypothetical protein